MSGRLPFHFPQVDRGVAEHAPDDPDAIDAIVPAGHSALEDPGS